MGIAKAVGLGTKQSQDIQKIFLDTDKVARKLVGKPNDRTEIEKELTTARETEQRRLNELWNLAQRISLTKSMPMNTR